MYQPHHLQYEPCMNLKCPIYWLIDFGLSPKLGNHQNMVGGVIWWVLNEIQWLELCNPPTTPCTVWTSYALEVSNFFDKLILDRVQNLGNKIIWWEESFGEFWVKSNTRPMQSYNHSLYGENFLRMWSFQFLSQLISNRAQNLGNIKIWWEESFGEFWVKSNH